NDMISNLYDLNMVNKTFNKIPVILKLENIEGELKLVGNKIVMQPQGNIDSKFLVLLPKDELTTMNTPIDIGIYNEGKLIKKVSTSFLAPMKKKVEEDEED
ncbi:MAG TPA: FixG Ig-like domain-containing protein, partial [Ignavibacteriaceae bacterium]